jgi:hypothetical protein
MDTQTLTATRRLPDNPGSRSGANRPTAIPFYTIPTCILKRLENILLEFQAFLFMAMALHLHQDFSLQSYFKASDYQTSLMDGPSLQVEGFLGENTFSCLSIMFIYTLY